MAINKDSNGYTIGFAAVMVIVVGVILTFLAVQLKPIQQANVINEKKMNIIQALGVNTTGMSKEDINAAFDANVLERISIDAEGKVIATKTGAIDIKDVKDPFNVDLVKGYKTKPLAERTFVIYACEKDGKKVYVLPLAGKGLWDSVWGYIALGEDKKTVQGAVFDHKGETPGLGAEIAEEGFEGQFPGKSLFNANDEFVSIKVIKPGSKDITANLVDGISGGTFTGNGVDEMLQDYLAVYNKYFQNI